MSLIHGVLLAALAGVPISACSSPSDEGGGGSAGAAGMTTTSGDPCRAQVDATQADCPLDQESQDVQVDVCHEDQRMYDGNGCRAQYDAWLVCTAHSGYDCQQDAGCEASQAGYFGCQSQAVQRTGCVRNASQDALRCSDATKPYAFSCLGAAPASCVQVVKEGAGLWCCPQL